MHDLMDAFKALGLHGMASAWPEVLGTARMKSLHHEAVLHQFLPDARGAVPIAPRSRRL